MATEPGIRFVPGLGPIECLGDERFASPWLGTIERRGQQWLIEPLGLVDLAWVEGGGSWLQSARHGLVWIGPTYWPWVYLKKCDGWKRIEERSKAQFELAVRFTFRPTSVRPLFLSPAGGFHCA